MESGLAPGCVQRCRGCAHRLLPETESLHQKREFLEKCLGSLWPHCVSIEGPETAARLGYRQKSLLSVADGKIGMMIKAGSRTEEDEVLEIPECPVHSPQVNQIADLIRKKFPSSIPLVFLSQMGNLVGLVIKEKRTSERLLEVEQWVKSLDLSAYPKLGIYLNFNPSAGNRVFFTKGWVHIFGEVDGQTEIFGHLFLHGPSGFMQVHPRLYESAIRQVEKFFQSPAVIDLYSGLGISLWRWNKNSKTTIGVELSEESIRYGKKNGIENVLQGKCEERLPQLTHFLESQSETDVFCNPPRSGLESFVIDWMIESRTQIQRLAYLSCSPGTLSRDLELLVKGGYRIVSINAYDFFPQTQHVETLILLESS